MSEKQSRNFLGVLYPDAENYVCDDVLVRLHDAFRDVAYIVHNMDVTESGELKKAHIHWVGKRDSPAPLSTIVNALKIPAQDIEYCKNYRSALRYLVHADNKDKFQYSPDSVVANFPFVDILKDQLDVAKCRQIYNHIHDEYCTIDQLAAWCFDNDLWAQYRKNFALWSSLLREVNYNQ